MKPLTGIRVVELASWAFVPTAGSVLADWGADVVKVEHPERADPIRGLYTSGHGPNPGGVDFMWELHNRGKRDIVIDLATPGGYEVFGALVTAADVFLTNLLPPSRRSLRVDVQDVHGINPKIIYASGTGTGPKGPEAERGGYDLAAFWSRSGIGYKGTPPGALVTSTLPSAGFGDMLTGFILAGGVAAALAGRDNDDERGAVVETSLLAAGMWAMRNEITACQLLGLESHFRGEREHVTNPINAAYRTADGRHVQLVMLEADRHWPDLCRRLGRPDLVEHPSYATMELRARNAQECVRELDHVFAAQPLAHWKRALAEATGVWAVVQTPREAAADPQAVANGYVRHEIDARGREFSMVTNPVSFDGSSNDRGPAPGWGEHTDEVLAELGYDQTRLLELKIAGAVL